MNRRSAPPTWNRSPASQRAIRLAGRRQRLYPKHLLSWMMLRATRIRFAPWKNWQIRWFVRRYGVDMSIAADPAPASYPDFNTFFTRTLLSGARPLEGGPRNVVSPTDGTVIAAGSMHGRRVVRAKDRGYTLEALFGGDERAAAEFDGGRFAVIYLAPPTTCAHAADRTAALDGVRSWEAVQREPVGRGCDRRSLCPQRTCRLVLRHRSRAAGDDAGRCSLRGMHRAGVVRSGDSAEKARKPSSSVMTTRRSCWSRAARWAGSTWDRP